MPDPTIEEEITCFLLTLGDALDAPYRKSLLVSDHRWGVAGTCNDLAVRLSHELGVDISVPISKLLAHASGK